MIIDVHAHLGHHSLQDFKQGPEEILGDMETYGITRSFVLPFPSMKIKTVNDSVVAFE